MSDSFNSYLARVSATKPRTVEGLNNTSYFYYFNKLLKMLYSIFKFENLPETWNLPYLKEHLFLDGNIVVTDTKAGVLPLESGYFGINIYNQPTNFNVHNVVLGNIEGELDTDGIMIYCSIICGQYQSLAPLLTRYATLLSEVDASLQTTLINSRVAHVFYANSAAQAKTMQKMYDDISKGRPAVFIRKNGLEDEGNHALFNNVKQTYIGTELLDTKRTIMNEFLTELGINNANTDKKERLITDEVAANNAEMGANITEWYENIKYCFDKVNEKYDLNIYFDYNYKVIGEMQREYAEEPGVIVNEL